MKQKNIFIGFKPWKKFFINFKNGFFLKKDQIKIEHLLNKNNNFYIWGYKIEKKLYKKLKKENCYIVEDGFIRSFGLGSDLISPKSIVLDKKGIYFNSLIVSDLETILNKLKIINCNQLNRVKNLIKLIIKNKITKYNIDNIVPNNDNFTKFVSKKIILFLGQVTSDSSLIYGSFRFKNELSVIKKIKQINKNIFILYKPHPDVLSGNKKGSDLNFIKKFVNFVATDLSIHDCLELADEVHTLTSLGGFDALIRGKKVVTYGAPFYAGWGLTKDMDKSSPAFTRRKRKLTLEELVYGCLIKYPIYWDYEKNKRTTCEKVIGQIIKERDEYWKNNTISPIEKPYLIRQIKKGLILAKSYFI